MAVDGIADETFHREMQDKGDIYQLFAHPHQRLTVHHIEKLVCLSQAAIRLVTKSNFAVAEIGEVGFS
jgi:hypothetical protein